MSDTKDELLRKQIADLDAEFAEPEPPVETHVELLARLDELEGKAPAPEGTLAEQVTRGELRIRYDEARIRRNDAGQITEIVGDTWRKVIGRDESGRPTSIFTETEEVIEMPVEPGDEAGEETADAG